MTAESIPVGLGIGLYGLASLWSIRDLVQPGRVRPRAAALALAMGTLLLLAVLLARGLAGGRMPVFGRFEALTVYSLVVTTAFLAAAGRRRMHALLALLAPYATVLLLVGAAAARQEVRVAAELDPLWLGLHVGTAFAGYALCTLAGVLGLAYLIQDRNLKRKRLGVLFERLPSLESLDRTMATQIGAAFIMLTVSVGCGARLVHLHGDGPEWLRDPKVLSTLATWAIYAVLMHMRTNADRHGRGMAAIALLGLTFVLFSFLGIHVLASSLHDFAVTGGVGLP